MTEGIDHASYASALEAIDRYLNDEIKLARALAEGRGRGASGEYYRGRLAGLQTALIGVTAKRAALIMGVKL